MKKIALCLFFICLVSGLYAANQVVTNNNDSGTGSLRQAIADVGSGETITFDNDYTITLSSALDIAQSLTITGTGAASTIIQAASEAGTASDRVINISSGTVTLENMTIRYGNISSESSGYGAGIEIAGGANVTVSDCYIHDNSCYYNSGGIDCDNSTLTVENSTIANNTGFYGGGIYSRNSIFAIQNSTIYNNFADGSYGGGIYLEDGSVSVLNCTISDNTCSGSNGGGGIELDGSSCTIKNTILANNTANGANDDYDYYSGTLTDNGYNILEYSSVAANATGGFNNANTILYNTKYNNASTSETTWTQGGTVFAKQNLYLSSTLALNNNPHETYTLTYTDGSSIGIDDGTNTDAPTTDQRGAAIYNGIKDIGAYEWQGSPGTLPVELSAFTAQYIENTPTIHWSTQSETDNMGWFIYRSEENDFSSSEEITGMIEGHGTTTQQQFYTYEDTIEDPQAGDTYYYWLESIDYSGIVNHYDNVAVLTIPDEGGSGDSGVTEPEQFGLLQNEPNPVITSTRISFNLPETAKVDLALYNLKGQLVKHLYSGVSSKHAVMWDGKDEQGNELGNGVYFYRLSIDGKTEGTKKLILMK